MTKIKNFYAFILEQASTEKVPMGFEEQSGDSISPDENTDTKNLSNATSDGWTVVKLEEEISGEFAKSNQIYKKFIGDLLSFSKDSELEGTFSKFTKDPNRFKYVYTKHRTGEVRVVEFTIGEFNKYYKVVKDYEKIENIAEKFERME